MSGLAGLLAGHHPAGVYLWHTPLDAADVAHAAVHAGWSSAYVDGWTHQDKAAALAAIGEALGFGDHFGRNLDALEDSLRDLSQPTVLLWDGWGPLAREDGRTFAVIVEIFGERSSGDGPPFAVLLRGAGPEVDLPSLD